MTDFEWIYRHRSTATGTTGNTKFYFVGVAYHRPTGSYAVVNTWGKGLGDMEGYSGQLRVTGTFRTESGAMNAANAKIIQKASGGYAVEAIDHSVRQMPHSYVTGEIETKLRGAGYLWAAQSDPQPSPADDFDALIATPVWTEIQVQQAMEFAVQIDEARDVHQGALDRLEMQKLVLTSRLQSALHG